MLNEYAVEPEAIGNDYRTFRSVISLFGVDRGRLISKFPENWIASVLEAATLSGVGDIKIATIEDRLTRPPQPMLLDCKRIFDTNLGGWLDNAIAQHQIAPFKAILARQETSGVDLLNVDEFIDTDPAFDAPVSWEVPRTCDAIADALLPIIKISRRVHIIDPFFDFRNRGDDYKGTLQAILFKLHQAGRNGMEIYIHYRTADPRPPIEYLENNRTRLFEGVIPDGYTLFLHEWAERNDGADFHDRHLVTDVGGLTLGAGFGASNIHQKVNITRMGIELADTVEARFDLYTGAFECVSPVLKIESNLNITRQ